MKIFNEKDTTIRQLQNFNWLQNFLNRVIVSGQIRRRLMYWNTKEDQLTSKHYHEIIDDEFSNGVRKFLSFLESGYCFIPLWVPDKSCWLKIIDTTLLMIRLIVFGHAWKNNEQLERGKNVPKKTRPAQYS